MSTAVSQLLKLRWPKISIMEQSTHVQEEAGIERPKEGRSILGVSAAITNYFNIPVGLIRAGFVRSVFFGGLGIAAYAAG